MESLRARGVVQDQNLNAHFNGLSVGKTNGFKALRNRGLGGARKPLGDLSNAAATPASTLVSKKQTSKTETFCDTSKNKSVSKAPDKVPRNAGRKALSDISNSGKPQLHRAPKKSQNAKLSALAEESNSPCPQAIVEERFLHNHHECIKAQMKAIDMDEFLKTIGLNSDNGFGKSSSSSKSKTECALKYLELDEMDVPQLDDDQFILNTELSDKLYSPPCKTPKPTTCLRDDYNHFNFVLMDTPKLSKHY